MPKGYQQPSPSDIARRIYGTFTSILHTDHEIDEETWDDMPEEFRTAFIEAVQMVVNEELEEISRFFDKEVAETALRKAQQVIASAPPPSKVRDGKWIDVCYYCGVKRQLVKWGACEECLKP